MQYSCKGCKERKLHCHNDCEIYHNFVDKKNKIKQAKMKENREEEYFIVRNSKIKKNKMMGR